ncbi:hypothetical protein F4780DRAFT_775016 [Xylariomycetidae sp. FL0641]|nr:hypothetical protein F4780DRAFT_775016 [Xylariomycetidae sp. FL0641]
MPFSTSKLLSVVVVAAAASLLLLPPVQGVVHWQLEVYDTWNCAESKVLDHLVVDADGDVGCTAIGDYPQRQSFRAWVFDGARKSACAVAVYAGDGDGCDSDPLRTLTNATDVCVEQLDLHPANRISHYKSSGCS